MRVLNVCHLVDPFVAHAIKLLDVQHYPVAGYSKFIH